MPAREVFAPDGRRWVVRRRWVARYGAASWWDHLGHRWERRRGRRTRRAEHKERGCNGDLSGFAVDSLQDLALVILAAAAIVLLVMVLWPLLLVLVDALVLLVLAVGGACARVVLRRPWAVDAVPDVGDALRWRIIGWRRSGRLRDEIAEAFERGLPLPGGDLDRPPRSVDEPGSEHLGEGAAGPPR